MFESALRQRFSLEWLALTPGERRAVLQDFRALCREEYDVPDATMGDLIAAANVYVAGRVYHQRIGTRNLMSYARSLMAGKER